MLPASPAWFSLNHRRWVKTDILDPFDRSASLLFKVKNIVMRVLLLQPLQEAFVLLGDPLHLSLASIEIEAAWLRNGWPSLDWHASFYPVSRSRPRSGLLLLECRDGRHIAFLVLGEVDPRTSQDRCHLLKQDSVLLLNLSASLYTKKWLSELLLSKVKLDCLPSIIYSFLCFTIGWYIDSGRELSTLPLMFLTMCLCFIFWSCLTLSAVNLFISGIALSISSYF